MNSTRPARRAPTGQPVKNSPPFQLGRTGQRPEPEARLVEDDELAALRQVLASAERVERLCAESYASLYDRDDAILAGAWRVWRRVGGARRHSIRSSQPYLDGARRDQVAARGPRRLSAQYADGIEASPARLQQVEERLALLERLKRKHGPTLADVIARTTRFGASSPTCSAATSGLPSSNATHARRAARTSRQRRSARAGAAARGRGIGAGAREALGELAMEQTRFEVRFSASPCPRRHGRHRHRRARSFSCRRTPAKSSGRSRGSCRAASCRASCSRIKTLTATSRLGFSHAADRPPSSSAPGLIFDEVDAGIGGRVADVVGRKLRDARVGISGSLHHAPSADCRIRRHALSDRKTRRGGSDADDRQTSVGRITGRRARPDARRRIGDGRACGSPLVRCYWIAARHPLRREAKAKGRKRKSAGEKPHEAKVGGMARKYLIETFGCQMNVHDSERMAGLLEQAGFESTDDAADADVVVINTCSVRERAEEKLYTRLGELRQLAARAGSRPDCGCGGLRRAAGRGRDPQTRARRSRRHRRDAGDPPVADARRRC